MRSNSLDLSRSHTCRGVESRLGEDLSNSFCHRDVKKLVSTDQTRSRTSTRWCHLEDVAPGGAVHHVGDVDSCESVQLALLSEIELV